jgi:hypothetical protein
LVRLEPKVTASLFRFFDTTLRGRALEWEPRLNLTPVTYSDIQTVPHTPPSEKAKIAPKDQARKPAGDRKAEGAVKTKKENVEPKAAETDDTSQPPR